MGLFGTLLLLYILYYNKWRTITHFYFIHYTSTIATLTQKYALLRCSYCTYVAIATELT